MGGASLPLSFHCIHLFACCLLISPFLSLLPCCPSWNQKKKILTGKKKRWEEIKDKKRIPVMKDIYNILRQSDECIRDIYLLLPSCVLEVRTKAMGRIRHMICTVNNPCAFQGWCQCCLGLLVLLTAHHHLLPHWPSIKVQYKPANAEFTFLIQSTISRCETPWNLTP